MLQNLVQKLAPCGKTAGLTCLRLRAHITSVMCTAYLARYYLTWSGTVNDVRKCSCHDTWLLQTKSLPFFSYIYIFGKVHRAGRRLFLLPTRQYFIFFFLKLLFELWDSSVADLIFRVTVLVPTNVFQWFLAFERGKKTIRHVEPHRSSWFFGLSKIHHQHMILE